MANTSVHHETKQVNRVRSRYDADGYDRLSYQLTSQVERATSTAAKRMMRPKMTGERGREGEKGGRHVAARQPSGILRLAQRRLQKQPFCLLARSPTLPLFSLSLRHEKERLTRLTWMGRGGTKGTIGGNGSKGSGQTETEKSRTEMDAPRLTWVSSAIVVGVAEV